MFCRALDIHDNSEAASSSSAVKSSLLAVTQSASRRNGFFSENIPEKTKVDSCNFCGVRGEDIRLVLNRQIGSNLILIALDRLNYSLKLIIF